MRECDIILEIEDDTIHLESNDILVIGSNASLADAEEADVMLGKTFFAGADKIKTGTMDLPNTTAIEEDVRIGKTFFSKDNIKKEGIGQFVNPTLANATEEDVFADATFYSGEVYIARRGGIDPYLVYLEYDDQLQQIETGISNNLTEAEYEEIKELYLRLVGRIFEGELLYGSTSTNIWF